MSKIQFEQINDDVVEVSIPSDTPMELVHQLTKSLLSRGLVEDLAKSTLAIRYFYRPEDKANQLADKLIKSLEGMSKDDQPYWSTKSKFSQQKQNREMDIAERRAKNGIKQPTNVSPAPEPHIMPDAPGKMYDNTPAAMRTAEGTGKRYAYIKDPVAKQEHAENCDCAKCKADRKAALADKIKQRAMKKSAWVQHNAIPSAEEEIMKLAKSTAQSGEHAAANQLANLMMGKKMLGENVHPVVQAMMVPPPPQPTDEQLFGHLVVTEEVAKSAERQWNGTINNWLTEATKPISQRFASEAEEEAYWASIKVSDRDDGSSGY